MDTEVIASAILATIAIVYITMSSKGAEDNPIKFDSTTPPPPSASPTPQQGNNTINFPPQGEEPTHPVLPPQPQTSSSSVPINFPPDGTVSVSIEGGMPIQLGIIHRRYPSNVFIGRSEGGIRKMYITKRGMTRGDWEYCKRLSEGTLPFSGSLLMAEFHNMNLWRSTWHQLDAMRIPMGTLGYEKVSLPTTEQLVVHLGTLDYNTIAFVYDFKQALGTIGLQQAFLDNTRILAGKKSSGFTSMFGSSYEPVSESTLWDAMAQWINIHSTL